jgi:cytochrome c-type biogenesis protein CcmH/NrfG
MADEQGRWDVAEEHYLRVVILKPEYVTPRVRLARVLVKQGRSAEAAKFLREALRIKPEYSTALNMLARILATSGDASVRDGVEAVKLAKKACRSSGFTNRRYLLTLGAAYAEAGDFESAIHYQKKLVETASAEEKTELVRILRLYESKSPLRE